MKTGMLLLGAAALGAVGVALPAVRNGLFASVDITERQAGPYVLIYRPHVGDYKRVGEIMDRLYYDLVDNHGIRPTKGFGLYFDDPRSTPTDRLRSIAGCIIEGESAERLGRAAHAYEVEEFPSTACVAAQFPYKGKLSIMLGVFKVYPKLNRYLSEKGHPTPPIMEIYDQPNGKIEYLAPVEMAREQLESFMRE